MAKSIDPHGKGMHSAKDPKYGLKQINKAPQRVRGQSKQPDPVGSNGVVENGSYAGTTLLKPGTHAPALFDGNTKRTKKIGVTALPDAPNPGNMGEGGADIPGGGTFQNQNYPITAPMNSFTSGNTSSPKGGNRGPVHDMREVGPRARALVYGGQKAFSKTLGESDTAGPAADFKPDTTASLRAKAEDMPYELSKSYQKKGAHGTSVTVKALNATVKRPLTAA